MHKPKESPLIALGLTVFNRLDILSHVAASLRPLLTDTCRLYVINDGSSAFSEDDLKRMLPKADIQTNEKNSGRADFATFQVVKRMLEHDARYLVILDSDLLCHSHLVDTICAAMPLTDGMMTILNSDLHKPIDRGRISIPGLDNALLEKKATGAAGCVWTRELLAEVVREVPCSETWDWDFCAYLRKTGRRILSLERSAVQHLGFWVGQNTRGMNGAWGLGYPDLDGREAGVLTEMLFRGTRAAFAHEAERHRTRYVSAHQFMPRGEIRGRGRSFSLTSPFAASHTFFLDEGRFCLTLDAAIVSARHLFSRRPSGHLSVVVRSGGVTLGEAMLPIADLAKGDRDSALVVEVSADHMMTATVDVQYRGPPARHTLQLYGLMIDRL